MKKVIPKLYQIAKSIYMSLDRSKYPEKVIYQPGRSWNIEGTIFKYILSGKKDFNYDHVVCINKQEQKNKIILLIDKSHSVLNYLRLIILSSILFSLSLDVNDIAIIGFDTQPEIIKSFRDFQMLPTGIIDRLLNIKSGGKTDIYSALIAANKEFSKQISSKKTLVMISDLLATTGRNYITLFRRFSEVRIIITPKRQTLQLINPLLGQLRKFSNVKLYYMSLDERTIPELLESVLYG